MNTASPIPTPVSMPNAGYCAEAWRTKTHADLAERLNLPLSTTVELRKREGWPHVRLGKAVRFTDEQIAEIVASHVVARAETESTPVFEGQRPSRSRRAS